jgi:ribosomal protein L11 methyltransferase
VALERAEEARASWLERFPAGFEERELPGTLELAAYVDEIPDDLRDADAQEVDPDWESRWRVFHRPATIGSLWVGPPWERPTPGLMPIVIDPGRAFGTGAHATTRLCLEYLLELVPSSLVDVGCGSGVLAIAAAKLGYDPVFAVDVDPAAVEAAAANASLNGVEVGVRLLDATREAPPEAELAVANIARETVEALAGLIRTHTLVTSGYLVTDRPEPDAFVHAGRRTAERWAADLWLRRE